MSFRHFTEFQGKGTLTFISLKAIVNRTRPIRFLWEDSASLGAGLSLPSPRALWLQWWDARDSALRNQLPRELHQLLLGMR
jgi:hypothetical protein